MNQPEITDISSHEDSHCSTSFKKMCKNNFIKPHLKLIDLPSVLLVKIILLFNYLAGFVACTECSTLFCGFYDVSRKDGRFKNPILSTEQRVPKQSFGGKKF